MEGTGCVGTLNTYYLLLVLPCLNLFPAQKIRNKTVEVPFAIPGAIIERQIKLRVQPIVESNIGFILEFDRNSSA